MEGYFNPYQNTTFGEFILLFFQRMFLLLTGQINISELATDEVQILVLCGIAASSALVGTFLILRKMTMLANSLSHTILLGIVITFVLTVDNLSDLEEHRGNINIQAMLFASLLTGIGTTFFTEFLTKNAKLQEDASTGIVFTTFFALGIILVTLLTRQSHIGAEIVMGNVDALHFDDLKLVGIIVLLNLLMIFVFFKEYVITTFDPSLSRALGISTAVFNYLLMAQVSITVVGAFRAVGVLMVLAFITGPTLSARFLSHDLKKILFIGTMMGISASIIGVAISRHVLTVYGNSLSTAGLVVCTIVVLFLICILFAPGQGVIANWFLRRKLHKKVISTEP